MVNFPGYNEQNFSKLAFFGAFSLKKNLKQEKKVIFSLTAVNVCMSESIINHQLIWMASHCILFFEIKFHWNFRVKKQPGYNEPQL